jgi:hypothetical protein
MTTVLALILVVLPSQFLDKPTASTQVPRVERLASQLHIGNKLDHWVIIVTDFPEYQRRAVAGGVYGADMYSAFTDPATKTTYINADWLAWGVTDKKLLHVLRHEAGHLICGCVDEDRADETGAKL